METHSPDHVLTFEVVQESVAQSLGISRDEIQLSTKLRDLGDSMEIAQLVLDLEQDFKVEITDDELCHIFSIQDVLNYLNDPRSY